MDAAESRNGLRHVVALSMTKLADGLIDPKLVLAWLMGTLGAPAYLIGLLVPIREAGALLPQIALAGWVRSAAERRWFWVAGSALQGVAALGIALVALGATGQAAGLMICGLLGLLALARAACSVSYKDVLGKTVAQTRRGAVTGMAGSVSSALVLVFALLLLTGILKSQGAIIAVIGLAALLWLAAAALFSRLEEERGMPGEGDGADILAVLRDDANLRWFILVRGLLVSTALAPPYLVMIWSRHGDMAAGKLGVLVLASAAAGLVSSYVWGLMADRSSRTMLLIAGLSGGAAMLAAALSGLTGLAVAWVIPATLFLLMIAYHGVRQARSTYLVDISPEDRRSINAAVTNTAIGLLLLAVGALGGALTLLGPAVALLGFAALAFAGGIAALRLRDTGG